MPDPGDDSGDCPRCDATMTQIGHDRGVVGAICETCNLMVSLTADVVTLQEATDRDWSDYEPRTGAAYGPDAWG